MTGEGRPTAATVGSFVLDVAGEGARGREGSATPLEGSKGGAGSTHTRSKLSRSIQCSQKRRVFLPILNGRRTSSDAPLPP